MRVYLSRWTCLDVESNLNRLTKECHTAITAGAELVVFPESFLHGYTQQLGSDRARSVFSTISLTNPDIAFFFGSFTENRRNRMTVWRGGKEIGFYDKVHLFAPNGELDIWDPGDEYVAVRMGDWTIGLLNCNDLRFPEQARALRLRGKVDALIVVAWWPWRRDHVWRTLLSARAIENAIWVMGCCVAAAEVPGERFAGAGNYVFDPHGEPVRTFDDRTYLLDGEHMRPLIVDPLQTAIEVQKIKTY